MYFGNLASEIFKVYFLVLFKQKGLGFSKKASIKKII